jgi:hypothetical protein
MQIHGQLSTYHVALVLSACRHEARATLFTRWCREPDLPLAERIRLQEAIGIASDSRDKCLKLAGLDRTSLSKNPWDALDEEPEAVA